MYVCIPILFKLCTVTVTMKIKSGTNMHSVLNGKSFIVTSFILSAQQNRNDLPILSAFFLQAVITMYRMKPRELYMPKAAHAIRVIHQTDWTDFISESWSHDKSQAWDHSQQFQHQAWSLCGPTLSCCISIWPTIPRSTMCHIPQPERLHILQETQVHVW